MAMQSNDSWTILPGEGMGPLRFGMSSAEVDAFSDIYGARSGNPAPIRVSDALLLDTLEKFGDALSDAEKQDFVKTYTELGPSADDTVETRGEPGLRLTFTSDRLVEIMPVTGHRPLFLDGVDILSLDTAEALAVLERANGGPGRYNDTGGAIFDQLSIVVSDFNAIDEQGRVQPLDESDKRFAERSVVVLTQPWPMPEAIPRPR